MLSSDPGSFISCVIECGEISAMKDNRKRPLSIRDRSLSPPPLKRKFESTTTSEIMQNVLNKDFYSSRLILTCITEDAVASFFTPLSRKEPEKTTWRIVNNSLLIGRYRTGDDNGERPPLKRRRIAAFDFVTTSYHRPFDFSAS